MTAEEQKALMGNGNKRLTGPSEEPKAKRVKTAERDDEGEED